jgi:tetratricopeptide (TPR) repeat protein
MHRGWAYRQLKQWDASIADYTKAMELDQKGEATAHPTKYRGELYMEMGEYEKAAEDFTLAISMSRFWSALYYLRGEAYIKMRQYEKAIENVNDAISYGATDLNGIPYDIFLIQRAKAYKKLGQKEKAEADLALIEQPPAKKRQKRGMVWVTIYPEGYEEELREEACKRAAVIKEFTAAIEANKNDAEAYYERGLAYMEERKYQKSIRDFTNAIRIDSNSAKAYFSRVELFDCNGQITKALTDYAKAISLDPEVMRIDSNLVKAYFSRAECFNRNGQITKALNDYAKVTSLDPNRAEAYEERAGIYEELGDTEKTIAEWQNSINHGYYTLEIIKTLAILYEETGRYENAVKLYTWYLSEMNSSSLRDWKSNSGPRRYAYIDFIMRKFQDYRLRIRPSLNQ